MIPRKRLHLILYILRILYVSGDGDPGTEGSLLTSTISSASEWSSIEENLILKDVPPGDRNMLKKELQEDVRSEPIYKSLHENTEEKTENFFNLLYDSSGETRLPDSSSLSEENLSDGTTSGNHYNQFFTMFFKNNNLSRWLNNLKNDLTKTNV